MCALEASFNKIYFKCESWQSKTRDTDEMRFAKDLEYNVYWPKGWEIL